MRNLTCKWCRKSSEIMRLPTGSWKDLIPTDPTTSPGFKWCTSPTTAIAVDDPFGSGEKIHENPGSQLRWEPRSATSTHSEFLKANTISLGIQSYLRRLGDWRHCYVGLEGPSTFWEGTWIPRALGFGSLSSSNSNRTCSWVNVGTWSFHPPLTNNKHFCYRLYVYKYIIISSDQVVGCIEIRWWRKCCKRLQKGNSRTNHVEESEDTLPILP